jgi:hypothetical protein
MIIDSTTVPENNIYAIGAEIISLLSAEKKKGGNISLEATYIIFLKLREGRTLSLEYFIYALDWLYLTGSVSVNDNNHIVLCS